MVTGFADGVNLTALASEVVTLSSDQIITGIKVRKVKCMQYFFTPENCLLRINYNSVIHAVFIHHYS